MFLNLNSRIDTINGFNMNNACNSFGTIQFEINALGTTWSLRLNKPYDDNGGEDSKRIDPSGKSKSQFMNQYCILFYGDPVGL